MNIHCILCTVRDHTHPRQSTHSHQDTTDSIITHDTCLTHVASCSHHQHKTGGCQYSRCQTTKLTTQQQEQNHKQSHLLATRPKTENDQVHDHQAGTTVNQRSIVEANPRPRAWTRTTIEAKGHHITQETTTQYPSIE